MSGMTDRDTFAAAALTGLLARGLLQSNLLATDAYKVADAMLRERERTNHDAAPAARAPEPEPEPAARRRPAGGTGDTPVTHATLGEGSLTREGTEPVAWGVAGLGRILATSISRTDAVDMQSDHACVTAVVPLYRQPPVAENATTATPTDAEREAIAWAATHLDHCGWGSATLRGLLERLR